MIVQGFPREKLYMSSFNTVGTLLKPKQYSSAGIKHMLKGISASGGTIYGSGIRVFRDNRVNIPAGAELIIFAVGDEAGETGELFAQEIRNCGYQPKAFAHIVNISGQFGRGTTVRRAAEVLGVSYTEVAVEQFTDVYQVQRTLKAVLEAQPYREKGSLVEKILQTELLVSPY